VAELDLVGAWFEVAHDVAELLQESQRRVDPSARIGERPLRRRSVGAASALLPGGEGEQLDLSLQRVDGLEVARFRGIDEDSAGDQEVTVGAVHADHPLRHPASEPRAERKSGGSCEPLVRCP
jgi:hypothetical protein